MSFNFDAPPDRRLYPDLKWGRYAGRDILPMWVADMDCAAPPVVLDAIRARIGHGVMCYTHPWPSLAEAVVASLERDHDWVVDPDWLVWLPGVVAGFNYASLAVGEPGTGVFTATPVYPPFLSLSGNTHRQLVTAPLVLDQGRWGWNRAATEAAIKKNTRLFMLCNPHNPVGRVFDEAELRWIGQLADEREMVICSDEIHCGLVLDADKKHRPIAALDPAFARRTITLMAPSKTWNIPALYCAFAVIPDAALRARFRHAMRGIAPDINILGLAAAEAAYRDGEPWRLALIDHLRRNRARILAAVDDLPGVETVSPEATFLAWLDCRRTGVADPAAFFEAAGVGFSGGRAFGLPGFVRLNFGCSAKTLNEALARMSKALRS